MMTLLLNFIPGAALHDDSNELSSGGSFLLFVSGTSVWLFSAVIKPLIVLTLRLFAPRSRAPRHAARPLPGNPPPFSTVLKGLLVFLSPPPHPHPTHPPTHRNTRTHTTYPSCQATLRAEVVHFSPPQAQSRASCSRPGLSR